MANSFTNKIMADGWRNAIIKITGVLDTGDALLRPAVTLNDFTNNDVANQRFVGFRLDHIWHSIGDGLEMRLAWNGANEETIFAIAGRGRESFEADNGIQPNQSNAGYDGSINLYTTGYNTSPQQPIQNFTVTLVMIKLYKS